MESATTLEISSKAFSERDSLWLKSKRWDLTFISFSAGLVLLPFAAYEFLQILLAAEPVKGMLNLGDSEIADVSRNVVNGLIALLIGGPHMYATYTRTFLDRNFRKHHAVFLLGSVLLPVGVISLGLVNFQLLVTLFFFWASVHILHQAGYIIDCYSMKQKSRLSLGNRILDYTVVFSSLYPLGVWRMVNDDFRIGQIRIIIPDFLLIRNNPLIGMGLFYLVTLVFAVSLSLWLTRSYREYRSGELHVPKFLLMSLTVVVSFFITSYHELDVAFQGFNTWHSAQYLGLTLYINRLRAGRGDVGNSLVRRISRDRTGWKFYLFNVGLAFSTVVVIAVLVLKSDVLGLSFDQCYYIVVLSVLLMHYFHDHLLFTDREVIGVNGSSSG